MWRVRRIYWGSWGQASTCFVSWCLMPPQKQAKVGEPGCSPVVVTAKVCAAQLAPLGVKAEVNSELPSSQETFKGERRVM